MKNIYNYIIDLVFPKKCINCGRENSFLCEDCLSLIELNQIDYCACASNPLRNKLRCEKCPNAISYVFTVLNEKQKLSQKLFLKSKSIPELNLYFSYLIISYLKKITNINLDDDFALSFENEDIRGIVENLSKFTKIKIRDEAKNVLLISKTYPSEDIFKKAETIKAKKIYVVSLFRQIS